MSITTDHFESNLATCQKILTIPNFQSNNSTSRNLSQGNNLKYKSVIFIAT